MHKRIVNDVIYLTGEVSSYEEKLKLGKQNVKKGFHVVNNIVVKGLKEEKVRKPNIYDQSLDGLNVDVLIIGGGISGCSLLRELTRYNLNVCLIEKESDVAFAASGRNDGEVHPGVDLKKGSLKQSLVVESNRIYESVCKELDVKFKRVGQHVIFTKSSYLPVIQYYKHNRVKKCGVDDTKIIKKEQLFKMEPHINKEAKFSLYNSMAGIVCPYSLCIAYCENAISNGAKVYLETMCLGLNLQNDSIKEVITNKGKIKAKIVVNASGTYAEEIAKMANDQFYSIHPRKGTDLIFDKKAFGELNSIVSKKDLKKNKAHSKGGGIILTVDNNILVGPDAIETPFKEDFSVSKESIDNIFNKQKEAYPNLKRSDIITYFSGIRACTYEEDFVIEWGRNCHNLYHIAGIQSPGLTTAPLVAKNVSKEIALKLHASINENFNPKRKGYGHLNELDEISRDKLIKQNSDYGIIICRCEEVSKGEIIDCLKSPLPIKNIDGIKKRVRAGMGRCQGGFCSPLVSKIIADFYNIPIEKVTKNSLESYICLKSNKGGENDGL